MNYTKTIIMAAVAALASTTWAGPHNGTGPMERTTTTTHVAVHHTTSNEGHYHGSVAKEPLHKHHEPHHMSIPNIQAKIRAARIADLNYEIKKAKALESPISCYSNYGTKQTTVVAQSAPAIVEQKSITICNSNVIINQ